MKKSNNIPTQVEDSSANQHKYVSCNHFGSKHNHHLSMRGELATSEVQVQDISDITAMAQKLDETEPQVPDQVPEDSQTSERKDSTAHGQYPVKQDAILDSPKKSYESNVADTKTTKMRS